MAIEIERKFRILDPRWREHAVGEGIAIRQFYLAVREDFSCRVRIVNQSRAVLTLKTGQGLVRGEFEYALPLGDADALEAARIGNVIDKRRFRIPLTPGKLTAEVDVFAGALEPMVIAEVELPAHDHAFERPDWFGPEVTHDPAYTNAVLAFAVGPPGAGAIDPS